MSDYVSEATLEARKADLTDDSFAVIMKGCGSVDFECSHFDGDDILIELIRRLGYTKTADAWEKLGKWYA